MSSPQPTGDTNLQLLDCTRRLARMARDEDLGPGDVTTALMSDAGEAAFHLVAKQACVVAGCAVAQTVLDVYGDDLRIDWCDGVTDGVRIDLPQQPIESPPQRTASRPHTLAVVRGPVTTVLSAERVLLNFLQRLCGVATLTRAYVDAVAGTAARIMDTRKTTPGWRALEKYAVRCGGGTNHRSGLYDAVMIKDNHLAPHAANRIAAAVFEMLNRATVMPQRDTTDGVAVANVETRSTPPADPTRCADPAPSVRPAFIEVEVDTPEQFAQMLDVVGVDIILLDNFSVAQLAGAVKLRTTRGLTDRVKLEASGGVNLDTVAAIARTGVDRISVGAITHSAAAVDLSLERI